MKRILILVCIINLVGLTGKAYSLPWPPDVWIVEISFNYDSGSYNYDALTIKEDANNYVYVPEWYIIYVNEEIAYIKNQTNRRIKAKFWLDRTGGYRMGVYADKIGSGTGIGDVNEGEVHFDDSQLSNPKILTCDGSVPGSLGERYFSWRWYATYIVEDWVEDPEYFNEPLLIGDSGTHYYYTLLNAPQEPMDEPWIEVLDYACDWANGTLTGSSAADSVANSIFHNLGDTDGDIDYQTPAVYTDVTHFGFELDDFLYDIKNISNVKVNCSDVANLFNIYCSALGIASEGKVMDDATYFRTNLINPIGGGEDWQQINWGYHQIGWYNDSSVYDACLQLNFDNSYVPTGLTQSAYETALIYLGTVEEYFEGTTSLVDN